MAKNFKNFWEGFCSLGSLGGDNSLFNDYLRGDNASDMIKDWEAIGNDMRKVMRGYKHHIIKKRQL